MKKIILLMLWAVLLICTACSSVVGFVTDVEQMDSLKEHVEDGITKNEGFSFRQFDKDVTDWSKSLSENDKDYTHHLQDFGSFTVPAGWMERFKTFEEFGYYMFTANNIEQKATQIKLCEIIAVPMKTEYSLSSIDSFQLSILATYQDYLDSESATFHDMVIDLEITEQGYPMIVIITDETLVYNNMDINRVNYDYYIVGDYKAVRFSAADYHNKKIPDVEETALGMVNSFLWEDAATINETLSWPGEQEETLSSEEFHNLAEKLVNNDQDYSKFVDGFGSYTVPTGWAGASPFETPKGSIRNVYYPNNLSGVATDKTASRIFVEAAAVPCSPDDTGILRSIISGHFSSYHQQNRGEVMYVNEEISVTKQGYPILTFTMEQIVYNDGEFITNEKRTHYIIGDNKVVVVNEIDYLVEKIPVREVAQGVIDSFVWA